MSVKNNSQRVVIIVIVVVFVLTSLGASGLAVYDSFFRKDDALSTDQNADIQKQLEELQKQQANEQNADNKENKLEGTKLTNFTPVAKVDTLQVIDLVPGTGAEAKADSTVTAHYTGALAKDGTIFQSSKDTGQQFTSPLSGLIPGWQQGIPGMKEGGTRRLIIPAALAYGDKATGNIPANSDLVFDIELSKVQ
jgi:FKBP-type peptidyl-prolyl cis-trans isomerase